MIQISSLRVRALGRVALLVLVLAAGLGLQPEAAWATHIRAGDIQAKPDTTLPRENRDPRRIFFRMILYLDNIGLGTGQVVDQNEVTIFFGDGTSSCENTIRREAPGKRPIPGNNGDTSSNLYLFEHTFPTNGTFIVSFVGENRNRGVVNMSNSDDQTFYISTTITIGPALLGNSSPILTAPAVDKAAVGQVFEHNPGAFDADGDSLAYRLLNSQQEPRQVGSIVGLPCPGATGNNRPVPQSCLNYRFPADPSIAPGAVQVAYPGPPVGRPGDPAIFTMDAFTGQIVWNAPIRVGLYNVAMVVEEWRRTPPRPGSPNRQKIGEVIRDMQITVSATNNLRPILTIPVDICVIAGERVTGVVTAVDGVSATSTPQTPISLFAYAGIIPPATFVQSQTGPPTARGTFNWLTECNDVARLPYQVLFKAQDNPNPITPGNPPLIDEQVWRITVVGPPPQNLRAVPVNTGLNTTQLNWDTYRCANASLMHIYRKENSGPDPEFCVTGIPASTGYVRIASVPISQTSFVDANRSASGANLGLERGKTYCYRIYAEFPLPAGGASIASREACATFGGRAAVLTNVDVETTSPTDGEITVRWTRPRPITGTTFTGTPSYVLSRGEGLNPTVFTPVRAPFTALTDTSYVDLKLDTQNKQYTYKLEFLLTTGTTVVPEVSPTASSVRTSAVPNTGATAFTVSWTYNVPWDNTLQPTTIFRRAGPAGPYVRIGTAPTAATGGTYLDRDPALRKGEEYCYYVQTNGSYQTPAFAFLSTLLNKSQERCARLISPPCTPVLVLQATNCDSLAALQEFPRLNERYTNRLAWTLSARPEGCDATIASYRVYYRPALTGAFALLATTTQPRFVHTDLAFSGGCYAVQAVAPSGLVSDTSNVACQDNCVFFKLPNIFTPNGDAQNAVFRPKNSSPIRSIRFQAFNRWGVKVFQNTTTAADRILINWDGGGPVGESGNGSAGRVAEGIYYYLAEVEFADFANTKRTYKGWVEIVR